MPYRSSPFGLPYPEVAAPCVLLEHCDSLVSETPVQGHERAVSGLNNRRRPMVPHQGTLAVCKVDEEEEVTIACPRGLNPG